MSDKDYYYSEESTLPSTSPSTVDEYVPDVSYSNSYIVYSYSQDTTYQLKAPRKVAWKKALPRVIIPKPRNRKSVIEPPPQLEFYSNLTSIPQHEPLPSASVIANYLQDVEKRGESFEPRKKVDAGATEDSIYNRLEKNEKCNVPERKCLVPTCQRRFIAIEILAYHMSYAHQQMTTTVRDKDTPACCMVCGMVFKNNMGKLTHMTSAHKNLARKHERLCLLQAPSGSLFPI